MDAYTVQAHSSQPAVTTPKVAATAVRPLTAFHTVTPAVIAASTSDTLDGMTNSGFRSGYPTEITLPIDMGVDATQLLATSRAFKRLDDSKVLTSLRKSLRTAAKPIVAKAKENASFSPAIASTISTTVSFTAKKSGVFITAKGSKMPAGKTALPKLMENGGKQGTFRHPVFGNDVWVDQPAHPFLQPALDGQEEKIAAQIREDIAAQIEAAGLEVK